MVLFWRENLKITEICSPEEAFKASVECITGPISKIISTQGMPAVYEALDDEGKKVFEKVDLIHPVNCMVNCCVGSKFCFYLKVSAGENNPLICLKMYTLEEAQRNFWPFLC